MNKIAFLLLGSAFGLAIGCGGGDSGGDAQGGSSGTGGTTGGVGGTTAGGSGGTGASSGTGSSGFGGAGGAAGSGGAAGAGASGGTAGSGGAAGAGASGGAGGSGGAAGAGGAGGSGGAAGAGGAGGTAGTGGTGGASTVCTTCHGSTQNPAPPKALSGGTSTQLPAVGAHQSHLGNASWHLQVTCTECHKVPSTPSDPAVPTHMNGVRDVIWGPLAKTGTYSSTANTCTGVYCHGATLKADKAGTVSNRVPKWTTVDGSQVTCGVSCHTTPPAGGHPNNTACATCHAAVIATFTAGNPPTATWTNANLHVNGTVESTGGSLNCTSCHGNATTANPSPPLGTNGETLSSQAAVGAHQEHLGASTWHRNGQCTDCHVVPTSTSHSNGQFDMSYSGPTAAGANPSFGTSNLTCTGVYCHGATLAGPKTGGAVAKSPIWNVVNGSWDACGTTCHTNPPGGTHVAHQDCTICHGAVVSAFNPSTNATTWANAQLHVNGIVEQSKYHDLTNWTSPKGAANANHHGSKYFLTNQQRDEHNVLCSACHGANLDGGSVGVSCNNTSCHAGQNWKGCAFCHGTPPNQNNPPFGVADETATTTLAVGRHVAHLNASTTHLALACASCHTIPATGDVAHAVQYVPSASLATPGHHGDVAFSAPYTAMVWNVNATQGAPATARGTCTGSCHSNGNGGAPVVTPYWAGGAWTAGSCGSCHAATPNTGQHDKHVNGEKLACTVCHNAANSATHMNGVKDVKSPINGPSAGSVTVTKNACTGGDPRCNGTCHGKNHNDCW